MKFLKAFGQFWYDFIIGDDWKIAAAVLLALVILFVLTVSGALGDTALTLLGGALIVVAFSISLAIDVRPKKR
ncbi:hypothetical protein AB0E69_05385 [Kribbella sp. NPDC026611]|uniref:hypothetical protein n=1 Tax=Kribbella sp. NPDC026611 TaxID=3154911 RepID=UPI0033C61A1E